MSQTKNTTIINPMGEIEEPVEPEEFDIDERTNYDGYWKGSVNLSPEDVIHRLLPSLYRVMDHTKKIRFLDKELLDTLPGAKPQQSPHFVDSLLEVPLKKGNVEYVLLHIEFQGPGGRLEISARMLHYFSLIYAHYQRFPVALLVLTSPHKNERTDKITLQHFGTKLLYGYNCINIANLDEKKLFNSDRLGDLLLYAVKQVVKINRKRYAGGISERRKFRAELLKELARALNRKHWDEEKLRAATQLVLMLTNLPVAMLNKVHKTLGKEGNKVNEFIEELFTDYMASREKRIYNNGEVKGRAEGKSRMARLVQLLLGEKRYDDLNRASTDETYCNSLFEAYGI